MRSFAEASEDYYIVLSNGIPSKQTDLIGIFEFDQAKALAAAGLRVVFVALDLRSIRRKRKFGIHKFEKDGILCYHASFPLGRVPDAVMDFLGSRLLKRTLRRVYRENGIPKLLHAHFFDIGHLATLVKSDFNFNLVLTEHSSLLNRQDITRKQRVRFEKTYQTANRVIAVSTSLANRIRELSNIEAAVVPNIVDQKNFDRKRTERKPSGKTIFVSVGALIARKNFRGLIEAFHSAFQESADELIIIGDGEEAGSLDELVRRLGISARVHFLGRKNRSEIADIFENSDFFVLLSRSETFGVVYIEALTSGLPVIATRCNGPEDFVREDNGIVVEVDDTDAAVRAMKDIKEKEYDRGKIASEALKLFSAREVAKQIISVYESL